MWKVGEKQTDVLFVHFQRSKNVHKMYEYLTDVFTVKV